MKANKVILNIDFLKKVIRLKNLKRDWLASQMLINPKTISRWTTGKVKHTDLSTIFRLSQIIECAPEELIIDESASSEASISTLKDSLIDANLPLMVSPSDNWSLLDVLTRLALEQVESASEKGKLYNWLSIANWRMERYENARIYAEKALNIAKEDQLRDIRVKAMFNLGTIDSLEKKYTEALEKLLHCFSHINDFDNSADQASLYTNLSMAYYDFGKYEESLNLQRYAIKLFEKLNRVYNLSIAYHCMGLIFEAKGERENAKESYIRAYELAKQSDYTTGMQSLTDKLTQIDAQIHLS